MCIPGFTVASSKMVWLRANYEFASTFSYRIPGASAQFAVGAPIPSPATVKLAIVDTAIRWSGNVDKGREVFNVVKTLQVCVVPPSQMVRFRAFVRRLKPPHSSSKSGMLTESTGVRDYFILDGPMSVYIETPVDKVDEIKTLLNNIRRFGTTDSVCFCVQCKQDVPDEALCPRPLADSGAFPRRFFVSLLADLTPESQFDGFNPFGGNAQLSKQQIRPYALPLDVRRSGETWAILVRVPLSHPK